MIKKSKSVLSAMKADTYRQYGKFSWRGLILGALTRRTFRVIVTMRLCHIAKYSRGIMRLALPLFKVLHQLAAHNAAVDFPWKTEIGPGLAITHGWGVVVNQRARIGANVTLFHGVTLGRRDRTTRSYFTRWEQSDGVSCFGG